MNLPQFLNQVDETTQGMSKDDLTKFIHQHARTLVECERSDFLSALKMCAGKTSGETSVKTILQEEAKDIREEVGQSLETLQQIYDGKFYIIGNLNEEYDDWYNSDADEFLFEDPQKVLPIVQDACGMVLRCMDRELYTEACHLAESLLSLRIPVKGDYAEYGYDDALSLQDLDSYDLISIDLKKWMYAVLLAAYISHRMEERPEILYSLMEQSGSGISMKELIQEHGEALDGLEEFLPLWIDYLGRQEEGDVEKLLVDAVSLMSCPEPVMEAAKKYAQIHPIIYEQVLKIKMGGLGDEEWYALGREAMGTISEQYRIRGRIALLTAACALRLGQREGAENCWLEAFRSDTKPLQYLRMAAECQDFSQYREEMQKIFQSLAAKEKANAYGMGAHSRELQENSLDRNDYYFLLFLDGQFEEVVNGAMQTKEALGWSPTFMKQGMALFLLYLLCEDDELGQGCHRMCESVFGMLHIGGYSYEEGFAHSAAADGFPFWEYFCKWRKQTPMEDWFQERILSELERWISVRTESIVRGQHRRQYGECAAFIAALGEVKASRGEPGAKARIFDEYRERYPRHRAFHEELRSVGMTRGRSRR